MSLNSKVVLSTIEARSKVVNREIEILELLYICVD